MCLSTVYENEISEDAVIMKKVSSIKVDKENITLTDLMERKKTVTGTVDKVDLLENYIVIKTKEEK